MRFCLVSSASNSHINQVLLYKLVQHIPTGRVVSYGQLASYLPDRIPALTVGRWMASCPPHYPWWRVVAADGRLVIAKRNPIWAQKQYQILLDEAVPFIEPDQADIGKCRWLPADDEIDSFLEMDE